ncbi:hypothetical protein SEA_NERGAL_53 [Mycobacterium Phage Nergal]|nr:hypothetical protein SEA_NERGAL_53 [Mycobacterium Phage Nergal]
MSSDNYAPVGRVNLGNNSPNGPTTMTVGVRLDTGTVALSSELTLGRQLHGISPEGAERLGALLTKAAKAAPTLALAHAEYLAQRKVALDALDEVITSEFGGNR